MVVDAIKRIFFRNNQTWADWGDQEESILEPVPQSISGPDYSEFMARLVIIRDELSRLKLEIKNDLDNLLFKIREAQLKGRIDEAEIYAVDYSLKRKVLHGVTVLEKLLSVVIMRLNSVKQIDQAASVARAVYPIMEHLTSFIASASPEAASTVMATKEAMEKFIRQTHVMGEMFPKQVRLTEIVPEAKEVLSQMMSEVQKEIEEIAPAPPKIIDYEELENKLLDYIMKNNGHIRLRQAAKELGVTPAVIKDVLYRLAQKGVITLTKADKQPTPA